MSPELQGESGHEAFTVAPALKAAGRSDFGRRAEYDVDPAPLRPPAWLGGHETLIRVRDAAVVLALIFVIRGVWVRVTLQPELSNKGIALGVGAQAQVLLPFVRRDDVHDVFVDPPGVGPRARLAVTPQTLELCSSL
jgi:hypothetical protein